MSTFKCCEILPFVVPSSSRISLWHISLLRSIHTINSLVGLDREVSTSQTSSAFLITSSFMFSSLANSKLLRKRKLFFFNKKNFTNHKPVSTPGLRFSFNTISISGKTALNSLFTLWVITLSSSPSVLLVSLSSVITVQLSSISPITLTS